MVYSGAVMGEVYSDLVMGDSELVKHKSVSLVVLLGVGDSGWWLITGCWCYWLVAKYWVLVILARTTSCDCAMLTASDCQGLLLVDCCW